MLCWNPHQESPIHSHSGSECFMRVLRGDLVESQYAWKNRTGACLTANSESPCNKEFVDITSASCGLQRVDSSSLEPLPCSNEPSPYSLPCASKSSQQCPEAVSECQRMAPQCVNNLKAGDVAYINDSLGLHKVENKSDHPAVTLHLYLPRSLLNRVPFPHSFHVQPTTRVSSSAKTLANGLNQSSRSTALRERRRGTNFHQLVSRRCSAPDVVASI